MANCILFGGEKGGVGKSTTAVNIAIMASLMGQDTLFVDTDKQRSTSKFFERRNERGLIPKIPCVHIMGKYLHSEIENLASKYAVVIIDAGGRDSVELRSAMVTSAVSKLYSPLQPCEFDMDTLETIDELTELSRTYNPHLQTYILLNMCPTHTRITTTDEAKAVIRDVFAENLQLCSVTLGHRVSYQYSISHSKSVVEYEAEEIKRLPPYRAKKYLHKASNEMSALYQHIFKTPFSSLIPETLIEAKKRASNEQ